MTDVPDLPDESSLLDDLGQRFLLAVQRVDAGDLDRAEDLLRDILRAEPRLPEPHLVLGRLLLDTGRLEPAEAQTRQALELLEASGPWTAELPPERVLALAHAQLAECLRQRADEDDVLFGDPDAFHAMIRDSQHHFARAAELDPTDETSSYYAFFMGPPTAAS